MEKYEDWKEEYYKQEKVDLKKYFSENDFEVLKKLGVEVLDKVYTENEFETLYDAILEFDEDEKEDYLEDSGISQEEYDSLLEKLDTINKEYNF